MTTALDTSIHPLHASTVDDVIAYFRSDIIGDEDFEISVDTPLIGRGLIDSMGIVRLLAHLQKRYGIDDFDNQDITLDNFRTIDRIAGLIVRYRQ